MYYIGCIDNGIGANIFTELTNDDINDKDLGFSFGGKKVLKNVLAEIKVWSIVVLISL